VNAQYGFRTVDGKTQARCVCAPHAPWETNRTPIRGHKQWSNEPAPTPGPWFDLPERREHEPFFDARTAGSSEPLRRYDEHASYPINIVLPLCGLCGKILAQCGHDLGFRLDEDECFEDVTPERLQFLTARAERWKREAREFWQREALAEVACG